jgi:hypothetical protein
VATDPSLADVGFTRLDAAGSYGFAFSYSVGFLAGGSYESIAVPRTRAEHVTPAPITWLHDAVWYRGEAFIDLYGPPFVQFEPAQQTGEWWLGAPLHAKAYGERGADSMFVAVADLRDTGSHDGQPWEWSEDPMAVQAMRLYRDGRLLASAHEPFLEVVVPGRPGGAATGWSATWTCRG